LRILVVLGLLTAVVACDKPDESQQLLDSVLQAHGGYENLRAASTWVAEVRRYQRGSSYKLRNYYRPGMVRLETDLGNGERSADVIGHPHCWGKNGPMTFPCSAETRENDRPRVVMEMAAQLWPLRGENWSLLSTSVEIVDGVPLDALHTRYEPLNSAAVLRFKQDSGIMHSISIDGIKGGRKGTHTHVYSEFTEQCGVLMPMHNVKSFEGDIWVEEDILQIECIEVAESMFLRPEQVADGYVDDRYGEGQLLSCADELGAGIEGIVQRLIERDGSEQFCTSAGADAATKVVTLPESRQLSVYYIEPSSGRLNSVVDALQLEARARDLDVQWPVRVMTYDNDGMGLTGEVVVEATVAVSKKQ